MTAPIPEPGDRVELVHTDDEYTELEPGDRGTVHRVSRHPSGSHIVQIDWDSGSKLMLLSGVDEWRVIPRLKAVD